MPGAMLIGDAACFVDVLLSSGVHLATYAALLAARSINSMLDKNFSEAVCMNEFEARLRLEYAVFYQGLVGLYDMTQDAMSYTNWLRTLLQHSNGVYIERQEKNTVMHTAAVQTSSAQEDANGTVAMQRSAENVAILRQYNAQQIRYAGAPGMHSAKPLPPFHPTLTPSLDQLYWLRVLENG
jgi:hypothetical protein